MSTSDSRYGHSLL